MRMLKQILIESKQSRMPTSYWLMIKFWALQPSRELCSKHNKLMKLLTFSPPEIRFLLTWSWNKLHPWLPYSKKSTILLLQIEILYRINLTVSKQGLLQSRTRPLILPKMLIRNNLKTWQHTLHSPKLLNWSLMPRKLRLLATILPCTPWIKPWKRLQKPRRAKARLKNNSMLKHSQSKNRLRKTLKKEKPNSMNKQTWKPKSEPMQKQRKRKQRDKPPKKQLQMQQLKQERMQSKPQSTQAQLLHKFSSLMSNLQLTMTELQYLQPLKYMNMSKPLRSSKSRKKQQMQRLKP